MRKYAILFPAAAMCLFAAFVFPAPALAADYYWNVASGDWSVGANWDPSGPPSGTDNAYIDNGGTGQSGYRQHYKHSIHL